MTKATLDESGIATKTGNITVYNYDNETREFLSSAVEFLAVGVGIPANSCIDAPLDAKSGFAVCRVTSPDRWEYVADHRGELAYSTITGQPVEITVLGKYADELTSYPPSTPYDKWDGNTWVTDKEAQLAWEITVAEQQKATLRTQADNEISWRQDAVDAGIATTEETAALNEWKKYRVLLMRINSETAPDIEWPPQP